ncbi:hypothetical protein GGR92_005018 [Spirosoma lacussanchae]|uniref:hypothetical protein n=1 Tax=Spirosoma lacussanchae TaxID=1884249 RepID=UPI001FEB3109|nr:hypothetical protein [Spirosoma lacussanchae]
MIFSFHATPDFDFITYFARHIQATVRDGLLVVPDHLGEGYVRKLSFGSDFKITIHRYLLREDLIINRHTSGQGNDLITLFFYNNEQALEIAYNDDKQVLFSQRDESAIQADRSSQPHLGQYSSVSVGFIKFYKPYKYRKSRFNQKNFL